MNNSCILTRSHVRFHSKIHTSDIVLWSRHSGLCFYLKQTTGYWISSIGTRIHTQGVLEDLLINFRSKAVFIFTVTAEDLGRMGVNLVWCPMFFGEEKISEKHGKAHSPREFNACILISIFRPDTQTFRNTISPINNGCIIYMYTLIYI